MKQPDINEFIRKNNREILQLKVEHLQEQVRYMKWILSAMFLVQMLDIIVPMTVDFINEQQEEASETEQ